MMYFRFLLTLAFGLFGVCLVLTVLLESVFAQWDFKAQWSAFLDKVSEKQNYDYVLLREEADGEPPRLGSRLISEAQRRSPAVQAPLALPPSAAEAPPITGMHRYWLGPGSPPVSA